MVEIVNGDGPEARRRRASRAAISFQESPDPLTGVTWFEVSVAGNPALLRVRPEALWCIVAARDEHVPYGKIRGGLMIWRDSEVADNFTLIDRATTVSVLVTRRMLDGFVERLRAWFQAHPDIKTDAERTHVLLRVPAQPAVLTVVSAAV